jgi:hypothetical protein
MQRTLLRYRAQTTPDARILQRPPTQYRGPCTATGSANPGFNDGTRGWYGALVDAIGSNMQELDAQRRAHVRHWLHEWPVVVDVVAIAALVAAIAKAAV